MRETAREFATTQLPAVAAQLEAQDMPLSHALVTKFAEEGFLGINIPTKYGGRGLGNVEAMIAIEEFAKISSAVALPVFESCVGAVRAIEHHGSEALRNRVVPGVCAGEILVAIAMSETDAGSALTDLSTRGRQKGDRIVINGRKRWCSGAGHADGYVVYCRLSDDLGAKGIGAVYVDKDAPGLTVGPRGSFMGLRGIPHAELIFEDVALPLENVIVPAGGFNLLMGAFGLQRCGNAAITLAQASGALEDVVQYVQERRQFDRPLVEFQAVQLKLADMTMKVEASRQLCHRAAANAPNGFPSVMDSSLAKCFSNESAVEVVGSAMQLMGAYGYSTSFPMERRLRDAWGWSLAGGSVDIQKINIASALVGRRFDQRKI